MATHWRLDIAADGSFEESPQTARWRVFVVPLEGTLFRLADATELHPTRGIWTGEEEHANTCRTQGNVSSASGDRTLAGGCHNPARNRDMEDIGYKFLLDDHGQEIEQERGRFDQLSFQQLARRKHQPDIMFFQKVLISPNRIIYDSKLAENSATGEQQCSEHSPNQLSLRESLQALRRRVRRLEEKPMEWRPGHAQSFENVMADSLERLGADGKASAYPGRREMWQQLHQRSKRISAVHSATRLRGHVQQTLDAWYH